MVSGFPPPHRGCLDLDARGLLDEAHNLHQRHRRIVAAKDLAIDLAELFQVRKILVHIDDVPGEAHEMFRPRIALGENRRDVAQGLANLGDKARGKTLLAIPPDYASGHHDAAVGRHAVRIPFGDRPAARLQGSRRLRFGLCGGTPGAIGRISRAHDNSLLFGGDAR
jgi:hypothetical protein